MNIQIFMQNTIVFYLYQQMKYNYIEHNSVPADSIHQIVL